MDKRDERKQTFGEASKRIQRHQNQDMHSALGSAWKVPTYWPGGVRRKEGMTLIWAFVRNLRTGSMMIREKAQVEKPRGPKVPMHRPGADCFVRAMKRGNARGAKGAGHPRRVGVNGQPEELLILAEAGRLPRGGTSRMRRESHVRICERLGVKFPGPTRLLGPACVAFGRLELRSVSNCPIETFKPSVIGGQRATSRYEARVWLSSRT